MKAILKLCSYFIFYSVALLIISSILLYFGRLDHHLPKLIPYLISNNNINIESIKTDKLTDLTFNSVAISDNNQIFSTIDEVNLHINWKALIKEFKLSSNIVLRNPKIYFKNLSVEYPKAEINYEYDTSNQHKAVFSIINSKGKSLCHGALSKKNNEFSLNDFTLNLDSNKNINVDLHIILNKDKSIKFLSKGSIKNFPIESYKILSKILPVAATKSTNKIFSILDAIDIKGNIKQGSWDINIDKLNAKNKVNALNCNFAFENTKIRYKNFPLIYDVDSNVVVKKDALVFNITNAKSQNTVAKSGNIKINLSENKIDIKAEIEGPISDLIPILNEHSSLNINQNNIQGTHNTNISIILDPKEKNIYSISSKANNVSFTMVNDKMLFTKGNLSSDFNGNTIEINGKGFLNKEEANISYKYHLKPIINKLQELQLETLLDCALIKNNIISINKCHVPLKVNWSKDTNNNNPIDIVADFTKSNVILNDFGITKPSNRLAIVTIKTNWNDDENKKMFVSVTGKDALNVKGDISWNQKNNTYDYKFNKIQYLKNDLILSGNIKGSNVKLFILANYLDLYDSNLTNLLLKKSIYLDSQIDFKAQSLKLRNNLLLKNVIYNNLYESLSYKQYNLYADLPNNQYIKIVLLPPKKLQKLHLITNNAGAILSGLGIYNKLLKGNMEATIYINDKIDYPSLSNVYGNITIKDFAITNMPFLARLFSLVSFPGLVNILINNHNMPFSMLKGNFSFSDGILSVSNTLAESHYFNLTMQGNIDCSKRFISLSGKSVPSFYGLSYILHKFLAIWQMNGVIETPFKIQESY